MHSKETISEPLEFQKEKRNRGDRNIMAGRGEMTGNFANLGKI